MVLSSHDSANEDDSGVIRVPWDAPEAWVNRSSISDAVLRGLITLLSWELDVLEVIHTKSITEFEERWLDERAMNFPRACTMRHSVVSKVVLTEDQKILLLVLIKRKGTIVIL